MSRLHAILKKQNRTVTCAESCTGGLIAKLLTDPSGASAVFRGSFVTYCNEMKQQLLGVDPATLATYYAVSVETAKEMALGALEKVGADLALSATGIAGPGTDDSGKPVGTVCLGFALRTQDGVLVTAKEFCFSGSRAMIRLAAARASLRLAEQALTDPNAFFGVTNAG